MGGKLKKIRSKEETPGLSGLVNKNAEGERRISALTGPVGRAFVSVKVDEAVIGVTENTLEAWCGECVLMAVVRQGFLAKQGTRGQQP